MGSVLVAGLVVDACHTHGAVPQATLQPLVVVLAASSVFPPGSDENGAGDSDEANVGHKGHHQPKVPARLADQRLHGNK